MSISTLVKYKFGALDLAHRPRPLNCCSARLLLQYQSQLIIMSSSPDQIEKENKLLNVPTYRILKQVWFQNKWDSSKNKNIFSFF